MTEKFNVRIFEVENGYVVCDDHPGNQYNPPRYVASTIFQLLEVVKMLCEKSLKEAKT